MSKRPFFSRTRGAVVAVIALSGTILLLGGCRDRGSDERESPAGDPAVLEKLVAYDVELDHIFKEAEDGVSRGDPRAAEILETRAISAADEALAAANRSIVVGAWAQDRRDALVALVRDRKREIPRYVAAMRGSNLDERLGSLEAQVQLQRRAMQLAASIARGPDAGSPLP